MPPLDFPASPVNGQIYQQAGFPPYVYDSSLPGWKAQQFAVQRPIAAPGGVTRLGKTANQSIPNNAVTLLTWDSEVRDDYDAHSNSTNNSRITVPAGIAYARFRVGMGWAANSTGGRLLSVTRNTAGVYSGAADVVGDHRPARANGYQGADSGVISVTPGDHYEVWCLQDSGGALNLLGPSGSGSFPAFFEAEFYTSAIVHPGSFRGVVLNRTSNTTFTNSTVAVSFQVATIDTDGAWNVAQPSRITIPAGITRARFEAYPALANGGGNYYAQIARIGDAQAMRAIWQDSVIEGGPIISTGVIPVVPGEQYEFATYTSTVNRVVYGPAGNRAGRVSFDAQFWP